MFRFASALLATVVGFALAQPAAAQTQQACAKRGDLIKHLEGKFSEAPVGMGIADNGGVVEIFASKDGSTWTVAITMPSGMSCLIATGQAWESLPWKVSFGPTT